MEAAMLTVFLQFLARALQPHRPSHFYVTLDRGPRAMKASLQSACIGDVEPFLTNGVVDFRDYKQIVDDVHKKVDDEAIEGQGPNRVLGNRPPLIDPFETSLPRYTRAVLLQLRSGHCAKLQSYLHFIGRAVEVCRPCVYMYTTFEPESHSCSDFKAL